MVTEGDRAPDFTAPCAGGNAYDDVEPITLSNVLGEGPIVLAFYPAAFTGGCTEEMCAFRDSMGAFEDLEASVYGISVDLPFAQNVWIREHELTVPMISDWDHEIIETYGVVLEGDDGMPDVAERSVFVLDSDGIVTYRWIRTDGNPDFEAFVTELQDHVERAADR